MPVFFGIAQLGVFIMLTLIGNSVLGGLVHISTFVTQIFFTCDNSAHTVDAEVTINSPTFIEL